VENQKDFKKRWRAYRLWRDAGWLVWFLVSGIWFANIHYRLTGSKTPDSVIGIALLVAWLLECFFVGWIISGLLLRKFSLNCDRCGRHLSVRTVLKSRKFAACGKEIFSGEV
jgi:hypothetical protein